MSASHAPSAVAPSPSGVGPTRTMTCEFDEQTELVSEREQAREDDEHTLRGPLIPEADVEAQVEAEMDSEIEPDPEAFVPVRPGPARIRAFAWLAFGGGVIGVISALLFR